MPKLLITGVSGLIGRIVSPFLEQHFELCGVDIHAPERAPTIREIDVAELDQVRSSFDDFAPIDNVLHLAADSRSHADWESVLRNNIHGTWNVFQAASETRVKRIVFASSNHVTGYYEGKPPGLHQDPELPMIEVEDPVRPDGPYGISKLAGEAIARYFYDEFGMEAVCLRIGSVLPDDDPTTNERNMSTWLSHRDLKQLVLKALAADQEFPGFGIYYGVSGNSRRFWDISNAEDELGYLPDDNATKPGPKGGRLDDLAE